MPIPDPNLEFQFDRRFAELETRVAFQEHTLSEMSDALAESRAENGRTQHLLQRALEDLKQLRALLYSDGPSGGEPGIEPPPPHY
ncbi:MAG TPA: SlyX family protein [Arenimonas sp.]|uniref:SlyX family protein n=1 Tax=Arenimonas sp. TaxID=1872635 RepID=UPI002B969BA3|nr:SlyX family protein [Arenimonas sp.]HMB56387.1 SlyX family protein [Arenimonas sp.]